MQRCVEMIIINKDLYSQKFTNGTSFCLAQAAYLSQRRQLLYGNYQPLKSEVML